MARRLTPELSSTWSARSLILWEALVPRPLQLSRSLARTRVLTPVRTSLAYVPLSGMLIIVCLIIGITVNIYYPPLTNYTIPGKPSPIPYRQPWNSHDQWQQDLPFSLAKNLQSQPEGIEQLMTLQN